MVLNFFNQHQQKDGSLRNVPYWTFTDWVNDKGWSGGMAPFGYDGNSAAMDVQLLMAYEAAALLEKQAGMAAFAQLYTKEINRLKSVIRSNYWNPSRQLYSDTKERQSYSQHVNSLAILTGVANDVGSKSVAERMLNDTSISKASVYFKYYLHLAMRKAGLGDKYLQMLDKWKENLAMGMTTWAETDDINLTRSDCHAWGSSPNIELFRIVLGIDSDAPGFAKVKIEPHPGSIQHLSGTMPHPKGNIKVDYKKTPSGKWDFMIDLPASIAGTFVWKGKTRSLKQGTNRFQL
jgi:hypothetical protein